MCNNVMYLKPSYHLLTESYLDYMHELILEGLSIYLGRYISNSKKFAAVIPVHIFILNIVTFQILPDILLQGIFNLRSKWKLLIRSESRMKPKQKLFPDRTCRENHDFQARFVKLVPTGQCQPMSAGTYI